MWQDLHVELGPEGLTVITVALDTDPEDARPYIEAAGATHPSLIDVDKRVADLYNMVNVPTVVWIDEQGRIVRPNDVHYVADTFSSVTRFHPRKPIAALRAWVHGEAPAFSGDVTAHLDLPTATDQEARAHYALGWWFTRNGEDERAERWFRSAGELAPHDFTIRRGSMPLRGIDPAGPEFFAMTSAWRKAGNQYYVPLPDTATSAEDFDAEPVPELRLEDLT